MVQRQFVLSRCDRRRTIVSTRMASVIRKVSTSCSSIVKTRRRLRRHCMASVGRKVSSSTTIKSLPRRKYRRRLPDWSNIHPVVLEKLQKLPLPDILRCRSVCSSWRSITLDLFLSSSRKSPPAAELPPLIIWSAPSSDYFFWFLDVSRPGRNLYHLNNKSEQLLCWKVGNCVGFSHGWFLFMDKKKKNSLCMFHPFLFSTAAARFPPIATPEGFPLVLPVGDDDDNGNEEGIQKAVLWADPVLSNGSFGFAIIHPYYKHIIFAKAGATQFTDLKYEEYNESILHDIICFKNCIYGVTLTEEGQHGMEAWDCADEDAGPRKVLDFEPRFRSGNGPTRLSTFHLVESEGELLLVSIQRPDTTKLRELHRKRRICFPEIFVSARCPNTVRVYKMDFEQREWVQMESLGDRVLFVMKYQNISVSTREFSQYKRNTVYFLHDIYMFACTSSCVGVFNMEDGSMEEIWPEWR